MSDPVDALTPEQIRQLIAEHDWFLKLIHGHPEMMMVDAQAGILDQLKRLADTHEKLLGVMEELLEVQRGRLELTRGYMNDEADDEEEKP